LGWTICFGVDRPGPCWTESFMGIPIFIGASLSDVRTIMTIMRVLVEELATSSGDEMDSNTRVLVVKCVWAPVSMSSLA
jgi:hypothetical protein